MALVMCVGRGESFFVDGVEVKLDQIRVDSTCVLVAKNGANDTVYEVSDKYATEVLPEVMVSVGRRGSMKYAKLAIEAPTRIKISRIKARTLGKGW